ncbi:hypothetical protein TrST_g1010 [Triparma strigata]|uniref:Uncharacterized protein n=1 Tax=Triparma strigata TaxID=1606541 RepID=A0A9W7DXH5_9STRA|nr:hypothetical protein TrST_g1010 [Triparma strigata]
MSASIDQSNYGSINSGFNPSPPSNRYQYGKTTLIFGSLTLLSTVSILLMSFSPFTFFLSPPPLPFKISLIRHSDKPSNSTSTHYIHLSPLGSDRAIHWSLLPLSPRRLIARKPEAPKYVLREIETLEPLSRILNKRILEVGVNDSFVGDILEEGRRRGGYEAIICWEHYNFHSLCRKLGGDIDVECPGQLRAWPNDDYSSMCTFHYEGGRLVEIEVDREIGKI